MPRNGCDQKSFVGSHLCSECKRDKESLVLLSIRDIPSLYPSILVTIGRVSFYYVKLEGPQNTIQYKYNSMNEGDALQVK